MNVRSFATPILTRPKRKKYNQNLWLKSHRNSINVQVKSGWTKYVSEELPRRVHWQILKHHRHKQNKSLDYIALGTEYRFAWFAVVSMFTDVLFVVAINKQHHKKLHTHTLFSKALDHPSSIMQSRWSFKSILLRPLLLLVCVFLLFFLNFRFTVPVYQSAEIRCLGARSSVFDSVVYVYVLTFAITRWTA